MKVDETRVWLNEDRASLRSFMMSKEMNRAKDLRIDMIESLVKRLQELEQRIAVLESTAER